MPVYRDAQAWVVDRKAAEKHLEEAKSAEMRIQRERYLEFLDKNKPFAMRKDKDG